MTRYILLHNPRCTKSRQAKKLLEEKNISFETREYLKDNLSIEELKDIQKLLGLKAIEFTRTKEKDFKDNGLSKESSDEEILKTMVSFPKLIERPILIKDNKKAIIGRPTENLLNLI